MGINECFGVHDGSRNQGLREPFNADGGVEGFFYWKDTSINGKELQNEEAFTFLDGAGHGFHV